MTVRQTAMDMPEVKREPTFESFVREQFVDAEGYRSPVTNIDEETWEPILSRDPKEYAEALAVCLERFHEDHEVKFRCWVETWIRR